jgi:peroxiredoxin
MRIIIVLIALMSTLCFGQSHKLNPLPKQLQGTIPSFTVLAIDNETELSKNDLKSNAKKAGARCIVLSLFAYWCPNCWEEFVHLKENVGELKNNGVQVYLIDVGESILDDGNKISNKVKEYAGTSFPLWFDPNGNLLKKFGFVQENSSKFSLPLIIILDTDLRVLGVLDKISKDDFPQTLWSEL